MKRWLLLLSVLISMVFVGDARTQLNKNTPLTHEKVFKLLRESWLLRGTSDLSLNQNNVSDVSGSRNLDWVELFLRDHPIRYSFDGALIFERHMVFPGAHKDTHTQYFLIALFDPKTIIGIEPDLENNKLIIFDLESDTEIVVDPFNLNADVEAQGLVGESLEKARCIWDTIKSRLAISGVQDIARFICNLDEETDDIKSMIGLAKSIGGCVTGGVGSCVIAGIEIGLFLGDPACRPSWVNACFGGTNNLDQQAINDMEDRARSDGRFGNAISGTFRKDLNWDPEWELRLIDFNFTGNRVVTIFHVTYKSNSSERFTGFYDPDNGGQWTGWVPAGVIAR